jgi:hypothetical protein
VEGALVSWAEVWRLYLSEDGEPGEPEPWVQKQENPSEGANFFFLSHKPGKFSLRGEPETLPHGGSS